jgi:hypothetical protein
METARRPSRDRWVAILVTVLLAGAGIVGAARPEPAGAATVLAVPSQYPTIQAAVAAAATGDTIEVGPGRYLGPIDYAGKNITIESTGGALLTTIDARGMTGVRIGPLGTLSGFTIENADGSSEGAVEAVGSGSVVRDDIFTGNASYAGPAAIGGNNASPTIEFNLFRANSCDTQVTSGVVSFVNTSAPTIRNNVFVNNDCAAIDITVPVGSLPVVVNNTMVANRIGIRLDARVDTSAHVYRNNVIVGNSTGLSVDFLGDAQSQPPTWDHNLVFGNDANYAGIPDLTGTDGNVSTDPRFVDQGAFDLHLRGDSPAIDRGTSVDAPALDFDQSARPVDGDGNGSAAVDLGAFEAPTTAVPVVAAGAAKVTEGNTGITSVAVPVVLSRPSPIAISVEWSTVDDEAIHPGDYIAAAGTLVFLPGEVQHTVEVSARGDTLDEPNEAIGVALAHPLHATLGDDRPGRVTIVDDDARVSLVTASASTEEGDDGGHALRIRVRLSAPSGKTVSVSYTTSRGSAQPGTDYLTKTGVLTFVPGGATGKVATVWVKGDQRREPDETFTVRFFGVTNASIPVAKTRVTATILDDD